MEKEIQRRSLGSINGEPVELISTIYLGVCSGMHAPVTREISTDGLTFDLETGKDRLDEPELDSEEV